MRAGLSPTAKNNALEHRHGGHDADDEQRQLPPFVPSPHSVPAGADAVRESMVLLRPCRGAPNLYAFELRVTLMQDLGAAAATGISFAPP